MDLSFLKGTEAPSGLRGAELAKVQEAMARALASFISHEAVMYLADSEFSHRVESGRLARELDGKSSAACSKEMRDTAVGDARSYERKIAKALREAQVPKEIAESGRLFVNLGNVLDDPTHWPAGIVLTANGPRHVLFDDRGLPIGFPRVEPLRLIGAGMWLVSDTLEPLESGSWNPNDEMRGLCADSATSANPFTPLVRRALAEL